MNTNHTHTRNTVAAVALVASGVVLGPGIRPAAADALVAPTLQSVRLSPPDIFLTFTDHTSDENGFHITVRERDKPDHVVYDNDLDRGSPGSERQVTRQVSGIAPGVAYCATVSTYFWDASFPPTYHQSGPSNTVCTDPVTAAAASDLALEGVNGSEERNFTQFGNRDLAYGVDFRNAGGTDATGVVVDVATSGVATLGDQSAAPYGFFQGFTCASRPPSGGETAALRCTGNLKQGQKASAAVIVRFTRPGVGSIHASISGAGDTNTANNGAALNVRVT